MPEITMCWGGDCPIKEDCYRFKAKPSPWQQSYFITPPWTGETCDHFWLDERWLKTKTKKESEE